MKRQNSDWLEDIVDAIDEIVRALKGRSRPDLDRDSILRAAVSHFVMIISEASRSVPEAYKKEFPLIDWRDIAGIGSKIRHGYYAIENDTLWRIYETELAALRHTALQLLKREGIERD